MLCAIKLHTDKTGAESEDRTLLNGLQNRCIASNAYSAGRPRGNRTQHRSLMRAQLLPISYRPTNKNGTLGGILIPSRGTSPPSDRVETGRESMTCMDALMLRRQEPKAAQATSVWLWRKDSNLNLSVNSRVHRPAMLRQKKLLKTVWGDLWNSNPYLPDSHSGAFAD